MIEENKNLEIEETEEMENIEEMSDMQLKLKAIHDLLEEIIIKDDKDFFVYLRDILNSLPNKTNFMKDLGLTVGYQGVRQYLLGNFDEMKAKGLDRLNEKVNCRLIKIPIPTDLNDEEMEEYMAPVQYLFQDYYKKVDKYISKFENDDSRFRDKELTEKDRKPVNDLIKQEIDKEFISDLENKIDIDLPTELL